FFFIFLFTPFFLSSLFTLTPQKQHNPPFTFTPIPHPLLILYPSSSFVTLTSTSAANSLLSFIQYARAQPTNLLIHIYPYSQNNRSPKLAHTVHRTPLTSFAATPTNKTNSNEANKQEATI
ncbi:MAG: hypothetical protein JOS17DRAFT_359064, partial [Linnemannia elongata]